jgi:hypothetical protein
VSEEAPIVDKVARSRAWIKAGLCGAIQLWAALRSIEEFSSAQMAPLRLDKKEGKRSCTVWVASLIVSDSVP